MLKVKGNLKLLLWRKMALLYEFLGQKERAITYLAECVHHGNGGHTDWWALGKLYISLKQWDEATKAFLHAIRLSEGRAQYLFWLGKAEEEVGHDSLAETLYTEAIKRDCADSQALAAKGELLLNRENYQDSLACFTQYVNKEGSSAWALNNIGLCYLGLNQPFEATHFFRKAIIKTPDDQRLQFNLATALLKAGEFQEAFSVLNRINLPEKPEVLSALAYCHGALGDYEKGLVLFAEALTRDPGNQDILQNMASLYAQSGDSSKAMEILKRLLVLNPCDSHLLNNIAWIYETSAQYSEAEKNYYRGLAVSPDNPEIAYNLICCLEKRDNYLEAIEMMEHLTKLPRWQKMGWSLLAQIYEKWGAQNLAVSCYNKALGLE